MVDYSRLLISFWNQDIINNNTNIIKIIIIRSENFLTYFSNSYNQSFSMVSRLIFILYNNYYILKSTFMLCFLITRLIE